MSSLPPYLESGQTFPLYGKNKLNKAIASRTKCLVIDHPLPPYEHDFAELESCCEVAGILHADGALGETYKVRFIPQNPPSDSHASSPTLCVLKLPPRDFGTFLGVQKHFEDESLAISTLAGIYTSDNTNHSTGQAKFQALFEQFFGRSARVIGTATLHDGGYLIPALLESFVDSNDGSLEAWLHANKRKADAKTFQQRWIGLAFVLTHAVRRLHNRGIVHGAIHPRHVIVEGWDNHLLPKLSLVGFGTSALLYDDTHIGMVKKKLESSHFAAPELRRDGQFYGLFSFSADIYALGVLLYTFALSGSDNAKAFIFPSEVESLKKHIARYMAESRLPESFSRIIDKCLRYDQRDRFKCADEMVDFVINAASREDRLSLINTVTEGLGVKLPAAQYAAQLIKAPEGRNQPASYPDETSKNFLQEQLERYLLRVGLNQGLSVAHGHCEYYGSRDEIINHLCDLMGTLSSGDKYCTVTVPGYWTEENLGSTGRFMVKNIDMAKSGVKIQRVFLVRHPFDELPLDEQLVLLNQLHAQTEVRKLTGTRDSFDVRVRLAPEQDVRDIERRRNLVAFAEIGNDCVGISFMSHGTPRAEYGQEFWRLTITKVRFEMLQKAKNGSHSAQTAPDPQQRFDINFAKATPIEGFVQGASRDLIEILTTSHGL